MNLNAAGTDQHWKQYEQSLSSQRMVPWVHVNAGVAFPGSIQCGVESGWSRLGSWAGQLDPVPLPIVKLCGP